MRDLESIVNYLRISDSIGTAGQPERDRFASIAAAGYRAVINLAMPTSAGALADEEDLVTEQGMEYVHIPVVWENPTAGDLDRFCAAMDRLGDRPVLVHCALNYRASAFVLLYRVLRLGEPAEAAWAALRQIWEPDETWQRFVDEALRGGWQAAAEQGG